MPGRTLTQEYGLALFLAWGTLSLCWARARLGDRETGVTELLDGPSRHTPIKETSFMSRFSKVCSPRWKLRRKARMEL